MRLADLGPRDTHLTLTHGEVLDADGLVSTENLRAFVFATGERLPAGQVDEVISAGRAGDVFEPRHTTHGFRYVQIDGVPGGLGCRGRAGDRRAHRPAPGRRVRVQRRAAEPPARGRAAGASAATPATSRPTARSASGRASPATGRSSSAPRPHALRRRRASPTKWLADLAADQWADGRVPTVVPNPAGDGPSGVVFEDLSAGSAGWGDAAVLVPWELWRQYGDLEPCCERHLPSMRAWVEVRGGRRGIGRGTPTASPRARCRLRTRSSSGTRASTSASGSSRGCHRSRTRPSTTASSRRRSCTVRRGCSPRRRELARRRRRARAECARIADGARDGLAAEFVTAPGRLTQRVAGELRPRPRLRPLRRRRSAPLAADRLAELIADTDDHLGTGFLSTGQLLPALADHGHDRRRRTDAPARHRRRRRGSSMIERGATTVVGVVGRRSTTTGPCPRVAEPLQQGRGAVVPATRHVAGIRLDAVPDAATAGYPPGAHRAGPGRRHSRGPRRRSTPRSAGSLRRGGSRTERALARRRGPGRHRRIDRTARRHDPQRSAAACTRSRQSFLERTSHDPAHLPRRLPVGRRHRRSPERGRQRRQRHLVPRERDADRVPGPFGQGRERLGAVGVRPRPRRGHEPQRVPLLGRVGAHRARRGRVLGGGARALRGDRGRMPRPRPRPDRDVQPLHVAALVRRARRVARCRGTRACSPGTAAS